MCSTWNWSQGKDIFQYIVFVPFSIHVDFFVFDAERSSLWWNFYLKLIVLVTYFFYFFEIFFVCGQVNIFRKYFYMHIYAQSQSMICTFFCLITQSLCVDIVFLIDLRNASKYLFWMYWNYFAIFETYPKRCLSEKILLKIKKIRSRVSIGRPTHWSQKM